MSNDHVHPTFAGILTAASRPVPRPQELRRQIAFANGFLPPAPIMVSTYEAELLAQALERTGMDEAVKRLREALQPLAHICEPDDFPNRRWRGRSGVRPSRNHHG